MTDQKTAQATVLLKPGKQWIGLEHLVWDEAVQPRAALDRKWANYLMTQLKEGNSFPAIKVYQLADGTLMPAEGHHRFTATGQAGESQILCDVVNGTRDEAIVFAAGSNADANGKRKMEDKDFTKAVEMLLAIEEWWRVAATKIGNFVGCEAKKVTAIRRRISRETGRSLPETVIRANGSVGPERRNRSALDSRISVRLDSRPGRSPSFRAIFKGKEVYGKSEEEVLRKLAKLEDDIVSKKLSLNRTNSSGILRQLGFVTVCGQSSKYAGVIAWHTNGFICVACDFSPKSKLPSAAGHLETAVDILCSARGQIIAAEYKKELGARKIILCYPEDGPFYLMELYRAAGFEFMTPDQLKESLKLSD